MKKNKMMIVDGELKKIFRSKDYNFDFDKTNGNFMRWGKTTASKDDPQFSPFFLIHIHTRFHRLNIEPHISCGVLFPENRW